MPRGVVRSRACVTLHQRQYCHVARRRQPVIAPNLARLGEQAPLDDDEPYALPLTQPAQRHRLPTNALARESRL